MPLEKSFDVVDLPISPNTPSRTNRAFLDQGRQTCITKSFGDSVWASLLITFVQHTSIMPSLGLLHYTLEYVCRLWETMGGTSAEEVTRTSDIAVIA